MTDLTAKVSLLSKAEKAALFNKPKMSDGEIAARLYLGNKQNEKRARVDAAFLIIWGLLTLAAFTSPAWLFGGF
jgi:hypothetical protein